ncbi:nitroreductase family protein [Alloscardovia venturai]|uniref:Nitroreductase family protein n=1 Tax=Alloscardovia venturai TaxID=1769421 RepID=A0ABW2Y2G4_9BIFI
MFNNDFHHNVLERHSVKKYDPQVKISREEILDMLNEAVTAPSAFNLQPWKFVVVDTDEGKAKIHDYVQLNAQKTDTASATIFIFNDLEAAQHTDSIYEQAVTEGHMPQEVAQQVTSYIHNVIDPIPAERMAYISRVDTGLVAMQLMTVAREHGYDTNPMTGFDWAKMPEVLGIDPQRYSSALMMTIGKAAEEPHTSPRIPAENITDFR